MSGINILKIENFCEYFENEPKQLGTFEWNMHEQIYVDISFSTGYQQVLSPVRSVVNGKNEKKKNEKHEKMNMIAKSKTWKGGLGKNEHPDGLTTSKRQSRQKQGQQKNYSPVDWKPERAIQAKMGW